MKLKHVESEETKQVFRQQHLRFALNSDRQFSVKSKVGSGSESGKLFWIL